MPTSTFPFPFVRHGPSPTAALDVWFALGSPSSPARPIAERIVARAVNASIRRVAGPVAEVRALGSRLPVLERVLRDAHAETPVGFAVCSNNPSEGSAWHAASMREIGHILDVLERLAAAHSGPYVERALSLGRSGASNPDVHLLLLRTIMKRSSLAAMALATLKTLRASCSEEDRVVLADQLLERLPRVLGRSFELDVVLRVTLAEIQDVSISSVAVPPVFSEALGRHLRTVTAKVGAAPRTSTLRWSHVEDVRNAIASGSLKELADTLREEDEAHVATLLALEASELAALAVHPHLATRIANAATFLSTVGRFAESLRLYDAAVEGLLPAAACANPLWAVQNDNNGLGVEAKRARRYLERCLPHAEENPMILLNACFVLLELEENAEALRVLAQARALGVPVKRHKNERLFIPVQNDPKFKELMR